MLNDETIAALCEALQDEYKAQATYRCVIEAYGEIRPFINIVEAEGRHISALLGLFDRYGLAAPEDDWETKVQAPASLKDACGVAVQAEIDNADMYDRLMVNVSEPDILNVFGNLQQASRDRHLPAFRRCAERYG
jgi:hypothetical protein